MTPDEWKKLFKQQKITARKYGGDDAYSWAVFKNGNPIVTGLSRGEVDYYKRQICKKPEEKSC